MIFFSILLILQINGENVVRASHDRVVHLIRGTGDTLAMKVVTVKPGNRSQDWFQEDKSLTMPNRKKKGTQFTLSYINISTIVKQVDVFP